MLKVKRLLDYKNLFSPNEYKNNIKTFSFTKYLRQRKATALFVVSIENLRNQKYHTFSKKHLSIFYSKGENEDEKILKEKSIEIFKNWFN